MIDSQREYTQFVRNRMNLTLSGEIKSKLGLACVGLAGEAGEVLEHYKKYAFHGRPLNTRELILELGDVMFYAHLLMLELGIPPSTVYEANINKLLSRDEDKANGKPKY
jgi:NTP pyrophosphatase (non-canonical NTP hydrolase)